MVKLEGFKDQNGAWMEGEEDIEDQRAYGKLPTAHVSTDAQMILGHSAGRRRTCLGRGIC